MKKSFLSAIITACCGLIANNGFAQTKNDTKNEEINIQKNNDSNVKTVIVIDSNIVTINGEPLTNYNGNVKVITRNYRRNNSLNSLSPAITFGYNNFTFSRAFLGIISEKEDKGALIKDVTKGSSAEKAGLQQSDIITKVADNIISGPDDLADVIKSHKPGDEVEINYLRNSKMKKTKVILGQSEKRVAFNFNSDNIFKRNLNLKTPIDNGFISGYGNMRNQSKIGLRIQETENDDGLKILNVEEGSAADKAGLKKDDIICEFNGEKVTSVIQILSEINQSERRSDFKIKVKRNNSIMDFDVKIPKQLRSADL